MLATWIRLFEFDESKATDVAHFWSEIISASFRTGAFDEDIYAKEYRKRIPILNKGERLIMAPQFYMVNLLKGIFDVKTESYFIDYFINNEKGIYYIYSSKITELPAQFASRQTSFYLAALEQIADYTCAREKLGFAARWLQNNKDENGEWDLGALAKDGIYFPLSDSWHKPEYRKADCTIRIKKLLEKIV